MSDEQTIRESTQASTEASTTEDTIDPVDVEALADNPDTDADIQSYDDRRDANTTVQDAIDATLAAGLGQDRDAIRARLNDELQKRDILEQPWAWVDAVVEEIQVGRAYQVSDLEN